MNFFLQVKYLVDAHLFFFYICLIICNCINNNVMLNLVGKGLKHLKEEDLTNNKNIQHINVSNNELDQGIEFKPLINLVTLVIDDNMFSVLTDFPIFKQL